MRVIFVLKLDFRLTIFCRLFTMFSLFSLRIYEKFFKMRCQQILYQVESVTKTIFLLQKTPKFDLNIFEKAKISLKYK